MPSFNFLKSKLPESSNISLQDDDILNDITKSPRFKKEVEEKVQRTEIILLGALQSGKSTLFKQIQNLKTNYFQVCEVKKIYADFIYSDITKSIIHLIKAAQKLDKPLRNQKLANELMEEEDGNKIYLRHKFWTRDFGNKIEMIYNEENIQELLRSDYLKEFDLNIKYFMQHFNRINRENYVPTMNDIVCSRVKTTGIIDIYFKNNEKEFKVIDKYLHFNYHVVNLTDSEEVNNCLDCIFTDNGRFLSKLLTISGKDFKLKLFNELNENHQLISDLDIIITSSQ
ncbi:hypothetical protein ABK040_004734 [Willaertia magna]